MNCTPWNAVIQALQAEGVEYVFGFPGDPRHLVQELDAQSLMRPDPLTIQKAVKLLSRADRPLLLCGSGAVSSGASDEVKALSEAAGIPVLIDFHTAKHDYPKHFVEVNSPGH